MSASEILVPYFYAVRGILQKEKNFFLSSKPRTPRDTKPPEAAAHDTHEQSPQ